MNYVSFFKKKGHDGVIIDNSIGQTEYSKTK